MEVVLIDKFVVPEGSKGAFLAEVRRSSAFLREPLKNSPVHKRSG
jgi:hypothetical protein